MKELCALFFHSSFNRFLLLCVVRSIRCSLFRNHYRHQHSKLYSHPFIFFTRWVWCATTLRHTHTHNFQPIEKPIQRALHCYMRLGEEWEGKQRRDLNPKQFNQKKKSFSTLGSDLCSPLLLTAPQSKVLAEMAIEFDSISFKSRWFKDLEMCLTDFPSFAWIDAVENQFMLRIFHWWGIKKWRE